jgi:hypothetical protein
MAAEPSLHLEAGLRAHEYDARHNPVLNEPNTTIFLTRTWSRCDAFQTKLANVLEGGRGVDRLTD